MGLVALISEYRESAADSAEHSVGEILSTRRT